MRNSIRCCKRYYVESPRRGEHRYQLRKTNNGSKQAVMSKLVQHRTICSSQSDTSSQRALILIHVEESEQAMKLRALRSATEAAPSV